MAAPATVPVAPFQTPEFNGQLSRSLGRVYLGAASLGETLACAGRIRDGDPASWHAAWAALAADLEKRGEGARQAGQMVTARGLFLRASEAWRQASFFHRADLDCPELQSAWPRHAACFRAAMALSPPTCRELRIPFEGRFLRGYLLLPPSPEGGTAPWPLLVVPSGYDGTAEESAVMLGMPALARGYAVLAFDGPGQGATLYDPAVRLYMRPDFESVLPAVVDAAAAAPGVDPARIGAVGLSFGGYLVPRGVAGEPRIRALVADPGQFDMGLAVRDRLPEPLLELLDSDSAEAESAFSALAGTPRGRMMFLPRMAAHGLQSVQAYIRDLRRYSMAGLAERIRCPALICDNEEDAVSAGQGERLAAALGGPVEFLRFRIAEGAGGHCEGVGREVFDERAFAWLDRVLKG